MLFLWNVVELAKNFFPAGEILDGEQFSEEKGSQ